MKNTVIIDGEEIDRDYAPVEYDRERFDYYFGKSTEILENKESEKNSSNIKAVNQAFQSINQLFNI